MIESTPTAKSDHITIIADNRTNTGSVFKRSNTRDRSSDRSSLRLRSRSKTRSFDTDAEIGQGFDQPRKSDFASKQVFHGWKLAALAYQSAGVIYGDIGTSPLYVFSSTFSAPPNYDDLLGALSLIIWTLTLIVTIKYVCIVLNADNEGQGGTFAMYSLLTRYGNIGTGFDPSKVNMIRFQRHMTEDMKPGNRRARNMLERHPYARAFLSILAIFGVCLIISDGVLTPAQSVLGAIQGINVIRPDFGNGPIIGITCAILVLIFAIQPFGVGRISTFFAPIVIVWLLFNFSFGVYNLVKFDYTVLKAFSPYFAGHYFVRNKTIAWESLGGILLCFTGCEALFADLGAFSKRAIQISWLCLAYPCLLMAYIGQAAHISRNPDAYSNPFFKSAPPGTLYPALIISILASIVASQALITSTFQLLFQVVNLSYFPPIQVINTSLEHHSQIFIPFANWLMMIGTIVVTVVFKDTTKLGNAYGVCVIMDTVITTTLVTLVALIVWRIKWFFVLPLTLTYATFEGLYMTSALRKVPDGGWFTVSLAVIIALIFCTWRLGKERQWFTERKVRLSRLSQLVKRVDKEHVRLVDAYGGGEITEMKGFGIFFDKVGGDSVPVIYEEFLHKFEAQPLVQVFLHLRATTVPRISPDEQYTITKTGLGHCYRMIIRYGYAEQPMTSELGTIVYEQLKQYIATELSETGATSAIAGRAGEATSSALDEKAAGPVEVASTSTSTFELPTPDPQTTRIEFLAPDVSLHPPSLLPPPASEDERGRRLRVLDQAYKQQVLFIVGKQELTVNKKSANILTRLLLWGYLWMRTTTDQKVTTMKIPTDKLIEVGFIRSI